jgi:S1-C subfamily serine protease
MEVNVKLNDGQQLTGRVVKIDKSADLAIVKVESVKS